MTSGRAAGFGILQEPFEYRIEVSWRFPERGVPQPAEAMTAALPHIGIRDGTDICRGAISYQVCYGAAAMEHRIRPIGDSLAIVQRSQA
jgi:hypothetical protein